MRRPTTVRRRPNRTGLHRRNRTVRHRPSRTGRQHRHNRSRESFLMSQGTLVPTRTKSVFLGEIAKYEGQTVTDFFAVAQKQFSRKRDGAAYLSLRLTDRTGQCEAKMWDN